MKKSKLNIKNTQSKQVNLNPFALNKNSSRGS